MILLTKVETRRRCLTHPLSMYCVKRMYLLLLRCVLISVENSVRECIRTVEHGDIDERAEKCWEKNSKIVFYSHKTQQ